MSTLQFYSPLKLHLHFTVETNMAQAVETKAHQMAREKRSHGEWFDMPVSVAIRTVRAAVEAAAADAAARAKEEAERVAWEAGRKAREAAYLREVAADTAKWKTIMDGLTADYERFKREQPEVYAAEMARLGIGACNNE